MLQSSYAKNAWLFLLLLPLNEAILRFLGYLATSAVRHYDACGCGFLALFAKIAALQHLFLLTFLIIIAIVLTLFVNGGILVFVPFIKDNGEFLCLFVRGLNLAFWRFY